VQPDIFALMNCCVVALIIFSSDILAGSADSLYALACAGPALADAGPNARPGRGVSLSGDFMTSSCSVNRVTIVVKRRLQFRSNTRIAHVG